MMNIGDVVVVGLSPTTVVLDDIGMDVPHMIQVAIPADKATISKDLWRAISQRLVFRVLNNLNPSSGETPRSPGADVTALLEKNRQLEAENQRLREALATQRVGQDSQLSEILALLKSGVGFPTLAASPGSVNASTPVTGVVEVETPAYIPSDLGKEIGETRLEVQKQILEGDNAGEARSALRRLRGSSAQ
jgi:hypothetical protein